MPVALLLEQGDAFTPVWNLLAGKVDVTRFASDNLGEQTVSRHHLEDVGRNAAQLCGFREFGQIGVTHQTGPFLRGPATLAPVRAVHAARRRAMSGPVLME